MWIFIKVFQGMQRKSCSTSWLLLRFWFSSFSLKQSLTLQGSWVKIPPALPLLWLHESTITSEAVYPESYMGRSGVNELVVGGRFMLFHTSLLFVVMYSIDISIKVQLAALSKVFQLPFSRWDVLGAYKRDKIQYAEQERLNLAWKDEVRNCIKSWMSTEFRCPGTTTQHYKPVHSLTKERRIGSFLLKHTKKGAAALLLLMYPKA